MSSNKKIAETPGILIVSGSKNWWNKAAHLGGFSGVILMKSWPLRCPLILTSMGALQESVFII
jgi:hypothetical protein